MLPDLVELGIALNAGDLILIWMVQIIIYPGFFSVPTAEFASFHASYSRRITAFVAPLLGGQLGLAILAVTREPSSQEWIVLGCIVFGWISTFTLSVPCHAALSADGKRDDTLRRLVRTNWVRTIAWTLAFGVSFFGFG